MSKLPKINDDSCPVTDHLLELFRIFYSDMEVFHSQFKEDDRDFLGIPPDGRYSSYDSHRAWVQSVYGLNGNRGKPESWKDTSHVGGLKLRSKYNSLVSHLLSDILKDGKITGKLQHTKESDIRELINKGELILPEDLGEEQLHQLIAKSEKSLEKAEQMLLDNKQEAKAEDVYYQAVRDYAKYGICALETCVRVDKKVRNYCTEVVMSEDGQEVDLIPLPSFKDSYVLTAERISPYDIFLDPEANGDPQKGVGVFKRSTISYEELSRLLSVPGYDKTKIKKILDEYDNGDSLGSSNTYNSSSTAVDNSTTVTKPFSAVTFWGNISRSNLEEWKKSSPLVKNLIEDLKAMDDVNYDEKYASFAVQAVIVDDILVYLSPLLTANQERPIAYSRMIPVEDTNYGMGVFALGREVARVMSKIWSRALNNETIVGNAMFTYDEKFVDSSSLIFKPGGFIRLKPGSTALGSKGNKAIEQIQFTSVSQSLIVLFDKLDMLLDELTMIPRNLLGVTQNSRMTATEVTQNLSSAQVMLLNIRRNFDRDIIEKDLDHTYHYIQNDPETPKEALSDAYVVTYGAETFALKIVNKQMVQELLQIIPSLAQVAPDLVSSFNWPELTAQVLEGLGFDKTKFMNNPELKHQLEQMNQQLQQLAQQLEASQKQNEEMQKEIEKVSNENNDLKLKNHQLSSQGKVEAKLNLAELEIKQLKEEIKNLNKSCELEKKIIALNKDLSKNENKKDSNK